MFIWSEQLLKPGRDKWFMKALLSTTNVGLNLFFFFPYLLVEHTIIIQTSERVAVCWEHGPDRYKMIPVVKTQRTRSGLRNRIMEVMIFHSKQSLYLKVYWQCNFYFIILESTGVVMEKMSNRKESKHQWVSQKEVYFLILNSTQPFGPIT